MEQKLRVYGCPKETVTARIMLFKNKKGIMVTDFFDNVARVLQGDILASFVLIICQDYELRTQIDLLKENGNKQMRFRINNY